MADAGSGSVGLNAGGLAPLLVLGSATCYTIAMVAMKLWGEAASAAVMVAIIAAASVTAVWLEILALQGTRLGMVYVAILGAECVMIAGVCHFYLGETFSPREVAGAALIVLGTAVAWA